MNILTPSGYKSPALLANGAEVCAFDVATGTAIINEVENIDFVDFDEWCRWWRIENEVPAFIWYRINGSYLIFREQSIWRNGTNVCHARDLVVGDEIYDDQDHSVVIASIEEIEDNSLVWYRCDISGDHSYIVDGLTVHNASRFWVGGTGTWDSSTTTNWSGTSGGAGGSSVPGSSDTVTLDASSGGGAVTVNFGGTITIQTITMGLFTGTFDNSVNNNNMTLAAAGAFNGSGAGTRTIKLGSATYTLSAGTAVWNFATATNLTLQASSSTIVFSGATGQASFAGGAQTYGTLSFGAISGAGRYSITNTNNTIATLTITAPNYITFPAGNTTTVTNAFSFSGTSSANIGLVSSTTGSSATIAAASGSTAQWCALRDLTFSTGSPTATNSFDLGNNSGATITAPVVGGGTTVFGVVGG